MTSAQRQLLERRTNVDTDKVMRAFEWLKENNELCKDMPTPEIGQPTIIDSSHRVESTNNDIETKEEITVVFPSGDVSTGGCDDGKAFEQAMSEIRSKSFDCDPVLLSKPSSRALRDFTDIARQQLSFTFDPNQRRCNDFSLWPLVNSTVHF